MPPPPVQLLWGACLDITPVGLCVGTMGKVFFFLTLRSRREHCSMCSGSEAGSYLRLIDSFIPQLKAQGPRRTCNEGKEGTCLDITPVGLCVGTMGKVLSYRKC